MSAPVLDRRDAALRPAGAGTAGTGPAVPVAGGGPARPAAAGRSGARLRAASGALTVVAVLLLGFVANVGLLGRIRHERDRQVAYADLRLQLANATAPVGQTGAGGRLHQPGTPMAVLRIPAIGLHEVVREGTTSQVLFSGPGHRRDSVLPGQAGTSVVMGRQAGYGGPFGRLHRLRPGDTLTVTTGQGEHRYRVRGLRRAGQPQPPPLEPGRGRLTLITADGPAFVPTGVLRVDADLVSDPAPTPRRVLAAASLPAAEKPMAGESGAVWIALVLWAQALVLAMLALTWARARWGRRQAWVVAVPVLGYLGVCAADHFARLLPNLL
jgi:sortase A